MLDRLLIDAARDRHRPWHRQTTGGLLVAIVLAAIAGGVLIDMLGSQPSRQPGSDASPPAPLDE